MDNPLRIVFVCHVSSTRDLETEQHLQSCLDVFFFLFMSTIKRWCLQSQVWYKFLIFYGQKLARDKTNLLPDLKLKV